MASGVTDWTPTFEEERVLDWVQHRDSFAGGFVNNLLDAISCADGENRAKLRLGFPEWVGAYEAFKDGTIRRLKKGQMADALTLLRDARALIGEKERWARGAVAWTPEGETAPVDHPNACQFCAIGALYRVAELPVDDIGDALQRNPENTWPGVRKAIDWLDCAASEAGFEDTIEANDYGGGGHQAVLDIYDRAIDLARGFSEGDPGDEQH